MSIIDTLLNPNGRISRMRFWLALIGLGVVVACLLYAGGRMQARLGMDGAAVKMLAISAVPLAWMGFCLLVKRWHDCNRSGLWLLILLLPGIGVLWTLVECGFIAGSPGGNRFGASTHRPGDRLPSFGDDIPEDMADPSGMVYVTPDHS
ncbi:MAG: DUF805 domain-containing protein [Asticcacaulis sp.]